MNEQFEIRGYWFLPNQENNRIAGVLNYVPNQSIRLELIGSFEEPMEYIKSFGDENVHLEDLIYGEDQNGNAVTLVGCSRYGSLNFDASFAMSKYTVIYLLKGVHLERSNSRIFNKIKIRIPLLTQWVNHYGIDYSSTHKDSKMLGYDLKYEVGSQLSVITELSDDLTLSIEHHSTIPDTHSEEISIFQHYTAILSSKTNKSWDEFLKLALRFKSFIGLATLTDLDFTNFRLYSPEYYQEIKSGERFHHPIGFFYKQLPREIDVAKKQTIRDILFTHNKIEQEFPTIIKRWYSFNESMAPIVNHLADSLKAKTLFRSIDFLTVCQALEGYHRRFFDKKKGEKKLESRIQNLLNHFREIKKIKGIDAKIVAGTRNYYSHFYTEENAHKILSGHELWQTTQKLRYLLVCCILNELEIGNEKTKEIIDVYQN